MKFWLYRFDVLEKSTSDLLSSFLKAINDIDPSEAYNGKLSDVWIKLANVYVANKDFPSAN